LPDKSKMSLFYLRKDVVFCVCTGIILIFLAHAPLFSYQEVASYNPAGKRDPFIPMVTPEGRLLIIENKDTTKVLNLEGIIYDKDDLSYAIVNGEIVKVGDTSGEYTVLKIEKNKVIFIKDGQLTEIELKEE